MNSRADTVKNLVIEIYELFVAVDEKNFLANRIIPSEEKEKKQKKEKKIKNNTRTMEVRNEKEVNLNYVPNVIEKMVIIQAILIHRNKVIDYRRVLVDLEDEGTNTYTVVIIDMPNLYERTVKNYYI